MNLPLIYLFLFFGTQPVEHWSGFRGDGSSHSTIQNLPLTWSDEQNLAWKIEMSGYGQSSPVIWNNMVFVTSIQGENKEKLVLQAFDLASGKKLWKKEMDSSNPGPNNNYTSKAAPTPVVDDKGVYAFYESGDLYAYSHIGELLWKRNFTKDYGPFEGNHGIGTSPAQNGSQLFFLISHSGPSYLLSVNKSNGETAWKVDREPKVSWTSPVVISDKNQDRILISSSGLAEEFSAENGERLWYVDGLDKNTVPSPTVKDDLVIIGASMVGKCLAIRRNGNGNVSESNVVWTAEKVSSSFSSPLVTDKRVYFVNKAGVVFCNDLQTGEKIWESRLPSSCWASAMTNGERIYFFCTNGTTVVIPVDGKFEKLAENKLTVKDRIYGVAVSDKTIVLRAETELFCIRIPE